MAASGSPKVGGEPNDRDDTLPAFSGGVAGVEDSVMIHVPRKFTGSDNRELLDVLIEANVEMDRETRDAFQLEVDGKLYGLLGIASLINQTVGYETELSQAHDERLNADYHNRIIKKRQYGYGRTAQNLADRALGVGEFASPSPAQREARSAAKLMFAESFLASRKKEAIEAAFTHLTKVFTAFEIAVSGKGVRNPVWTLKSGGTVIEGAADGAIKIVKQERKATGRPEGRP